MTVWRFVIWYTLPLLACIFLTGLGFSGKQIMPYAFGGVCVLNSIWWAYLLRTDSRNNSGHD